MVEAGETGIEDAGIELAGGAGIELAGGAGIELAGIELAGAVGLELAGTGEGVITTDLVMVSVLVCVVGHGTVSVVADVTVIVLLLIVTTVGVGHTVM